VTITLNMIDGLSIASETMGEGQPVLLLHGWMGRIENMQQVGQRLAQLGYHVHMIDLPGFGRSALPTEAWGVPEYARLVAHYLDHVNLKPVHLIGHSFGGRVSIVLGADYPEYVNKIVLTDSAGVPFPVTTGQQVRQALFQAVGAILSLPGLNALEPRFRRWARDRFGSEDLRKAGALEPIFRVVVKQDLRPYAARIKASTLLVWGDQDQDTPLWQGQVLEKTIPDAGLVVFQGVGHFAYQERIEDFIRVVDTFLREKR
jgi:pimeloyl-ACP methyl ester carboxylesterase